jgi:hypothetical protein
MFDDLTFALRYEPVIRFSLLTISWEIPAPITQETVEEMKRSGVWPFVEERFGPYVAHGNPPREAKCAAKADQRSNSSAIKAHTLAVASSSVRQR